MKTEITIKKEVEIKYLHLDVGPRYWEDATVNGVEDTEGNLIPFREGDRFKCTIDIDNGTIIQWPNGVKAEINYKVCDDGDYYLRDEDGETVMVDTDNYVPGILPGEHFGDYIILNVDEKGKITNWEPVQKHDFDHFKSIIK